MGIKGELLDDRDSINSKGEDWMPARYPLFYLRTVGLQEAPAPLTLVDSSASRGQPRPVYRLGLGEMGMSKAGLAMGRPLPG